MVETGVGSCQLRRQSGVLKQILCNGGTRVLSVVLQLVVAKVELNGSKKYYRFLQSKYNFVALSFKAYKQ